MTRADHRLLRSRLATLVLAAALALAACDQAEEPAAVAVRWIEVAASDYQLRLEPEFDASTTSYLAHADGPDIEVYVDVLLTADADAVRINGQEALSTGFRSWRSPPEAALISPTSVQVEVIEEGVALPTVYSIEVVLPQP